MQVLNAKVLIDTWWNVNCFAICFITERFYRFNRYMVECELIFIDVVYLFYIVLIDTWWNVNVSVI